MKKFKLSLIFTATAAILASSSLYASSADVINIAKPNGKGISVNNYNEFNVSKDGMILNNSGKNVATQLGGVVKGNQNMANGSARLIINQVRPGSSKSQLNGQIEVAGQKADVIVSNPNGITCSGCGFINTSSALLTTHNVDTSSGTARIVQTAKGNNGTVTFEGKGLVNPALDNLKIEAGKIIVDAPVQAKNVTMSSARSQAQYGYDVTLDVTELGAVKADTIYLVSDDSVARNSGQLDANYSLKIKGKSILNAAGNMTANDIDLDADKNLMNGGGNITARDQLVMNAGYLYNDQDGEINAKGMKGDVRRVNNFGNLTAKRNIDLRSDWVTNRGNMDAGDTLSIHSDDDYWAPVFTNYGGKVKAQTVKVGGEKVDSYIASDLYGGEFEFVSAEPSNRYEMTPEDLVDLDAFMRWLNRWS